MGFKNLETAIQDFNKWNGNARIYFDKTDSSFFTEVYGNDVVASGTFNNNDDTVAVYSKLDVAGHIKIGTKREAYIVKFCEMLLDGWEAHQVEYQLSDLYV